jgi:hypothetical protein
MHKIIKKLLNEIREDKETRDDINSHIFKMSKKFYTQGFISKKLGGKKTEVDYKIVKYKNKKYIVFKPCNNDKKLAVCRYNPKKGVEYFRWLLHENGYIHTFFESKEVGKIALYQHNYIMNKLTFDGLATVALNL